MESACYLVHEISGALMPERLCRRATAYQGSLEPSVLSDIELDAPLQSVVEGAS